MPTHFLSLLLLGVLFVLSAAGRADLPAALTNQGYQLRFYENFAGTNLNTNVWGYREDTRQLGTYIINALNTKDAVSVSNNALWIRGYPTNIGGVIWNAGGGIISKPPFGYGFYESLEVPWMKARGVHSAFWQRAGLQDTAWEIDSCEFDSPSMIGTRNCYLVTPGSGPGLHSSAYSKTNSQGAFLHQYEITPEGVYYWQNGRVIQTATWPELGTTPQKVWLTALNGTSMGTGVTVAPSSITSFKYMKYYAKNYPGENLLANGSFEMTNSYTPSSGRPMFWSNSPINTTNTVQVTAGNATRQNYKLRISNNSRSFTASVGQTLQFLNNGNYQLTAMVRSGGGSMQTNNITVSGYGGAPLVAQIPASSSWRMITIPRIALTNIPSNQTNGAWTNLPTATNQVTVTINCSGSSGAWTELDDVRFQLPPPAGQPPVTRPYVTVPNPYWYQAVLKPFTFSAGAEGSLSSAGAADWPAGVGPTFSASCILNATNRLYTVKIMSRLSSSGTSPGWRVQSLNNGQIQFQVGYGTTLSTIASSRNYSTNVPVAITCTYNAGSASMYMNGTNVANSTLFPKSVTDTNTKLAVGDSAFLGTISKVRIDNRILSLSEISEFAKLRTNP